VCHDGGDDVDGRFQHQGEADIVALDDLKAGRAVCVLLFDGYVPLADLGGYDLVEVQVNLALFHHGSDGLILRGNGCHTDCGTIVRLSDVNLVTHFASDDHVLKDLLATIEDEILYLLDSPYTCATCAVSNCG